MWPVMGKGLCPRAAAPRLTMNRCERLSNTWSAGSSETISAPGLSTVRPEPALSGSTVGPGQSTGRTDGSGTGAEGRSEEHTSELQSLLRISYDVFCSKKHTITQSGH